MKSRISAIPDQIKQEMIIRKIKIIYYHVLVGSISNWFNLMRISTMIALLFFIAHIPLHINSLLEGEINLQLCRLVGLVSALEHPHHKGALSGT